MNVGLAPSRTPTRGSCDRLRSHRSNWPPAALITTALPPAPVTEQLRMCGWEPPITAIPVSAESVIAQWSRVPELARSNSTPYLPGDSMVHSVALSREPSTTRPTAPGLVTWHFSIRPWASR